MKTVEQDPAAPPGAPPWLYRARVVGLGALIVGSTLASSSNVATLCLLAALLVGVSHGAFDLDLVAARSNTPRPRAVVGLYLLALTAMAAAWWWIPAVATLAFLLLSVQHFGDGDLHHPSRPPRIRRALTFSRGLMIIGATLLADPTASTPVVQALADSTAGWASPSAWIGVGVGTGRLAVALLALAHGLMVLWLAPRRVDTARELVETVLLATLFALAGPFVGFAGFFVLCHGADHVVATFRHVRSNSVTGEQRGLWRRAAITGGLGLLATAGAALWASRRVGPVSTESVAAMLQVVACLTVPHALVVAWIDPSGTRRQP